MKRFWDKVDRRGDDECWPWLGRLNADGYGEFDISDRHMGAHRVAYKLIKGSLPDFANGIELDHLCRRRDCVNPRHLQPVTHQENCARGVVGEAARRRQIVKTHCPYGHEYTPENTYTDPKLYNQRSTPSRHCRICRAAVRRKWRKHV